MEDKKSLTQHWREKEEYADKWVALDGRGPRVRSPFDMEPVAAADTQEKLFEKVKEMGLTNKDVSYFYNRKPGTIFQ